MQGAIPEAERDIDALDEVDALLGQDSFPSCASEAARPHMAPGVMALGANRLFFPDYAWLRHVDPPLQAAITSY